MRGSVPRGMSSYLKVTIAAVRPMPSVPNGGIDLGAGIVGMAIPGVSFQQQMKVPDDEANAFDGPTSNSPVIVFNRPIANANLSLGYSQTDDPPWPQFTVPKAMTASVSGYAVPVPSQTLEQFLEFLAPPARHQPHGDRQLVAGGPSPLSAREPGERFDPTLAGRYRGHDPVVEFSWGRSRTISSISLTLSPQASRPTSIAITSATGTRRVLSVPKKGGVINFPPLTTDSLRLQILSAVHEVTGAPDSNVQSPLPVGLSRIAIPALNATVAPPLNVNTPVTFAVGRVAIHPSRRHGHPHLVVGHAGRSGVSHADAYGGLPVGGRRSESGPGHPSFLGGQPVPSLRGHDCENARRHPGRLVDPARTHGGHPELERRESVHKGEEPRDRRRIWPWHRTTTAVGRPPSGGARSHRSDSTGGSRATSSRPALPVW